jgi:hypothetical protein
VFATSYSPRVGIEGRMTSTVSAPREAFLINCIFRRGEARGVPEAVLSLCSFLCLRPAGLSARLFRCMCSTLRRRIAGLGGQSEREEVGFSFVIVLGPGLGGHTFPTEDRRFDLQDLDEFGDLIVPIRLILDFPDLVDLLAGSSSAPTEFLLNLIFCTALGVLVSGEASFSEQDGDFFDSLRLFLGEESFRDSSSRGDESVVSDVALFCRGRLEDREDLVLLE